MTKEIWAQRCTQRGADVKTQGQHSHLQSRGRGPGTDPSLGPGPAEGTDPVDTLISDFQPPELGDNTFLLSKPCGRWYFVTVALTDPTFREWFIFYGGGEWNGPARLPLPAGVGAAYLVRCVWCLKSMVAGWRSASVKVGLQG